MADRSSLVRIEEVRGRDHACLLTLRSDLPGFAVSVAFKKGCLVLGLSGEFDMASEPTFQEALRRLRLLSGDAHGLVCDLSQLEFIDSTGLRSLLETREWATARGWRFALVPGPRPVQRVFQLCQLDAVLNFVRDSTELETVAAGPSIETV